MFSLEKLKTKKIGLEKSVGPKKSSTKFGVKNLFAEKKFWAKKLYSPKNYGPCKNIGLKKLPK